jgi:beta-lactamase class A
MAAVAAGLACLPALAQPAPPLPQPAWTQRLHMALSQLEARSGAGLGVYVRDLDTGAALSYRADETWYLASMVKVPVAIAVLRGVERGDYTLDTTLRLRAGDYVDGAGPTKRHAPGTALSIRYLIEQMIVYSDNTASDMLIDLVGIGELNTLVQSLSPLGFERFTSLADVRRQVYSRIDAQAVHLSGREFLQLQAQRSDADRVQMLHRLLHTPPAPGEPALGEAYDAYYATGLNSGRLQAYGDLLAMLVEGHALDATRTTYLLSVMDRVKTGAHRIKAGLPQKVRFAHKTGTQRARTCDAGLITVPRMGADRRIVVAACTRGEPVLARAERTLRDVGVALCESGVLTNGRPHDATCRALAPVPPPAHVDPGVDADER